MKRMIQELAYAGVERVQIRPLLPLAHGMILFDNSHTEAGETQVQAIK
jgi:hypothetical protein